MLAGGDRLGGKLRLERLLGRGASGEVWAAEHLQLGSRVAVKILEASLADRPDILQRFVNEARSVSQIGGPHVVAVHDCDAMPDGRPYIVMELLQGESLEQRLKRLGPLPAGEVIEAVQQSCVALEAAHARGIIHRDIKPANLFVVASRDGLVVKLIDFGIAKHPALAELGLTATGALLGTPKYMSPEQLQDPSRIDARADLWSLAVVAYECLTAASPFPSDSFLALCLAQKNGQFTPATARRADLPPSIDAWFARAFAPRIEQRFQSAAELSAALAASAPHARVDPVAASRRNFAIGPTAPHSAVATSGTMFMAAAEPEDDLAATVALGSGPPSGLQATVAFSADSSVDLGATVNDPSLSAIAPPAAPLIPPPPPTVRQRSSGALVAVVAAAAVALVALVLVWLLL